MIFKNKLIKSLSVIPDFIDCKKEKHLEVYHMMMELNDTLLELISLNVLSSSKVYGVVKRFIIWSDYCMDILDNIEKINFSAYYLSVFDWLLEESLRCEQFESAANLKSFNDIYERKYDIDENN